MPEGADYWSFGAALRQPGTIIVDDFSAIPIVSSVKPALSLISGNVYWASYADYVAGNLSVDNQLTNESTDVTAFDVSIVGAINTNSVLLATTPVVGDILPGLSRGFTLKYAVPSGVDRFRTTIFATAAAPAGNLYFYPGPYPR